MNKNIEILKKLEHPTSQVDVVLDTDAFNEIDDQFAIAYLLKYKEKLNTKAIYAAPFYNDKSSSPKDGMEKSYYEIINLLNLMGEEEYIENVYKGSETYLLNEDTPVMSDAANDLAKRAMEYTSENPLYVIAIGAITNIASAILINPSIKDKIVVVWLGGNALHMSHNKEFNCMQDVASARVVMGAELAFVQLPCAGVVSSFTVSKYELIALLSDKNKLCDYLLKHTVEVAENETKYKAWSRIIWDVTAVAWVATGEKFMTASIEQTPIPEYDHHYSFCRDRHLYKYVYSVDRDGLLDDMIRKLTQV